MIALTRSAARAVISLVNPHTLWATVVPFLAATLGWGLMLWFGWQPLVSSAQAGLGLFGFENQLHQLFAWAHMTAFDPVVAPLLVVMVLTPFVVLSVIALTAMLAPVFVGGFFARHRYAHLESKRGGNWFGSAWNGLWSLIAALVLLAFSMPFWLIPPLFVVLPALIWGWMTSRVLSYDMLAQHASAEERQQVIRAHRWSLLLIGIACTLLGALPTAVWVLSFWTFALFPVIALVMLWIYALVMVFSSLWFGYFCLDALEKLRAEQGTANFASASESESFKRS